MPQGFLNLRATLSRRVVFCALTATLCLISRFDAFDHLIWQLERLPNHDMSDGLAFFATSMHSLREHGQMAWWYPGSYNGYAQYYQAFFSPLAPTYGNIVFILWAAFVRALSNVGIAIPEYRQYIFINYGVLPWLAVFAFALFCSTIYRRRVSILLACLVFSLSGIGAWYSAWFYFQEPFTLFLLLACTIALLQKPTPERLFATIASVLIQLTSFNYWTVYNLFFAATVLGTYAITHHSQLRRCGARIHSLILSSRWSLALACACVFVTALLWLTLLGSAALEQAGNNVRTSVATYSRVDAFARIQEMRRYTTELFNPDLARALTAYNIINPTHNARYIGAVLVPFLALLFVLRHGRRTIWLWLTAVLVLVTCMGPPLLLDAWQTIPFMDRILHEFYFYSHYLQIAVLLLAVIGLDLFLVAIRRREARFRMRVCLGVVAALCVVSIAVIGFTSQNYPANDPSLQANLKLAVLTIVVTTTCLGALTIRGANNGAIAVTVLLVVGYADLTSYYATVESADAEFTQTYLASGLNDDTRMVLGRPWQPSDLKSFGGGLTANMPIGDMTWPANTFVVPAVLNPFRDSESNQRLRGAVYRQGLVAPPLYFYDGAQWVPAFPTIPTSAVGDLGMLERRLLITGPEVGVRATGAGAEPVAPSFQWREKTYNDFAFDVDVPADGWLYVRQTYDRSWRYSVDSRNVQARPANYFGTAIPLSRGSHRVEMHFLPLARFLYGPACTVLIITLALLAILGWRQRSASAGALRRSQS